MITGISGFFFCPKMAVLWRTSVFQKIVLKPYFLVFFGCALFGPSCQKRTHFGHPPKKKNLIDNWKALSLVFLCFFVFFLEGLMVGWVIFIFWGFVFPFLYLLFSDNKLFFPQRKGLFLSIFESLSLFLLSLFLASPFFNFSFSLSLSLSLSLLFFLVFFLVFLFCFRCFFLTFVSWKEQHQSIQLQFVSSRFLFFGFLSCFFFWIPFSYVCFSWF